VTLAGTPAAIAAFHDSRAAGTASLAQAVHAYIDLTPDDRPNESFTRRRVRYTLPEGLSLREAPPDAEFRLTERSAATQASTNNR
jgi:hypothetical protein